MANSPAATNVEYGIDLENTRTGELLAHNQYSGREAEDYKRRVSTQGLNIARPVPLTNLLKLARKSLSGSRGSESQVATAPEASRIRRNPEVK